MGNKGRSAGKQSALDCSPSAQLGHRFESAERPTGGSLLAAKQVIAGTDGDDDNDDDDEEEEEELSGVAPKQSHKHRFWFQPHDKTSELDRAREKEEARQVNLGPKLRTERALGASKQTRNQRAGRLTRWTNLVLGRSFNIAPPADSGQREPGLSSAGESACNEAAASWKHEEAKSTESQHLGGARRQVAAISSGSVAKSGKQAHAAAGPSKPAQQGGGKRCTRGWFLRSLSSSTSALLDPLGSHQHRPTNRLANVLADEPRTRSSCEHAACSKAQVTREPPPQVRATSHSSPYRQIARVLRLGHQDCAGSEPKLADHELPFGSLQTPPPTTKRSRLIKHLAQPFASQHKQTAPSVTRKRSVDDEQDAGGQVRPARVAGGKPLFGFVSPLFRRGQVSQLNQRQIKTEPASELSERGADAVQRRWRRPHDEDENEAGDDKRGRRAGSAKKKIRQQQQREQSGEELAPVASQQDTLDVADANRGSKSVEQHETSCARDKQRRPLKQVAHKCSFLDTCSFDTLPRDAARAKPSGVATEPAGSDACQYANEPTTEAQRQHQRASPASTWQLVAAAAIKTMRFPAGRTSLSRRKSHRRRPVTSERTEGGADAKGTDDGESNAENPAPDRDRPDQAPCLDNSERMRDARDEATCPGEQRQGSSRRPLDGTLGGIRNEHCVSASLAALQTVHGDDGEDPIGRRAQRQVNQADKSGLLTLIQPLGSSSSSESPLGSASSASSMSSLSGSGSSRSSSLGSLAARSGSSSSTVATNEDHDDDVDVDLSAQASKPAKPPRSLRRRSKSRSSRRRLIAGRKRRAAEGESPELRSSSQPIVALQATERPGDSPTPLIAAGAKSKRSGEPTVGAQKSNSGGVGALKSNFKKLVKRQQSVDSYRMARDLKNKQRRQQEESQRHQSNETIKVSSKSPGERALARSGRKFSMRATNNSELCSASGAETNAATVLSWIRIELSDGTGSGQEQKGGESPANESVTGKTDAGDADGSSTGAERQRPLCPKPPSSLSLMPSAAGLQPQSQGAFIVGSFGGYITPTYPTHHLPSPKYVSAAMANKKYSNASTISSSLAGDTSLAASFLGSRNPSCTEATLPALSVNLLASCEHSDTENSLAGSASPSSSPLNLINGTTPAGNQQLNSGAGSLRATNGSGQFCDQDMTGAAEMTGLAGNRIGSAIRDAVELTTQVVSSTALSAAAAARRAQLAEHIYDNKCGLGEDMKFLASLPELCDITFLVGETREPVCAVKSVLAARSRVFHKILFGNRQVTADSEQEVNEPARNRQPASRTPSIAVDRRDSSPRSASGRILGKRHSQLSNNRSQSPPVGRSPSPQQQQQPQQWSVTSDASGYSPTPSAQLADAESHSPSASDPRRSGGRSSAAGRASGQRESTVSQSSWQTSGSQQPLVIGPGQTAAPAKRSKKSSIRDSRLSRMFMSSSRRASDPSIKHNQAANLSNQSYTEKMSSSQMSTTMIIEEFEPDVFRQLIEYIHTGCVLLQARTLLGLLNAADYYGLEQLRKACLRFVSCCITVDTVCSLLSTAERYIQYKCTKSIVQKVLEFVDTHADEIFKLNAFGLLPEHVVRLILARDGLKADEEVKYNGVHTWCEHYCRSYELTNISDVMRNFLDLIQFHKIPTNVLLSEIYPTHIVPDNIFLSALAYQADPQNFEPEPLKTRRMTLPNPTVHDQDYDQDFEREFDIQLEGATAVEPDQKPLIGFDEPPGKKVSTGGRLVGLKSTGSRASTASELASDQSASKRKLSEQQQRIAGKNPPVDHLFGSQDLASVRRTTRATRLRKGSIAQVSLSGVLRLSHRLSIKKKNHSGGLNGDRRRLATASAAPDQLAAGQHQRLGGRISLLSRQLQLQQERNQQSDQRDPMQVGQQILEAYLAKQRQRELEEAAQRRRQAAEEEAERRANREQQAELAASMGQTLSMDESRHNPVQIPSGPSKQQPIVKVSAARKSFKDFKHISRRIFMRHPSSAKMLLQQQHSSGSTSSATTVLTGLSNPSSATAVAAAATGGSTAAAACPTQDRDRDRDRDKDKRRSMLKIRRSETVFEATGVGSTTPVERQLLQQLSANLPSK